MEADAGMIHANTPPDATEPCDRASRCTKSVAQVIVLRDRIISPSLIGYLLVIWARWPLVSFPAFVVVIALWHFQLDQR